MSEAGPPMGFPPPHPDGQRNSLTEGLRLLYVILGIVLAGAGAFVGFTLGLS